ncbi:radical SAM/SPASM domain-containing protein [Labrys wisconsinensis]|uniref:MoaA/NifB/PqqE/SkfB family radical SAM enzyme n=1 Tax=Labrys wisconsinensis TaxID=425677 RepID=A0ABU0J0C0_9HYPH|nr:radical SAM/SPASM domain-containing protein [Labrys wisconsinensis]MDQ0467055.1 MoaA/NifB/PqqE/SkfB family radical SAM enzyme [Labrys wisconsinensis]
MIDLVATATKSAAPKGLHAFRAALEARLSRSPLGRRAFQAGMRHLPLRFFKKLPTIIIIDVTNSCNLRCPVCPVTFAMHRPRGLMTLDIFKQIVDDFIPQPKKPAMYFNFSGEPTLNKALPDMIAYAHTHGHETFVSTNATKLSSELIEKLIRSGLSRINLCIDGFSKEAQEAYRVGSKFEQVKANIENFLAIRARLGATNPTTVLQTLLTSYSEKQVDEMVEWADRIGFDQVRFKTFSLGSYTDDDQQSEYGYLVPENHDLQRHQTEKVSLLCDVPLYQTVVFWNGDLGLCCIDYDQVIKLPSVDKVGFIKAYLSDEATRARRTGYTKSFSICQSCSYSNADNMGFKIDFRKRRRRAREAAAAPAAAA